MVSLRKVYVSLKAIEDKRKGLSCIKDYVGSGVIIYVLAYQCQGQGKSFGAFDKRRLPQLATKSGHDKIDEDL